jgi:hypothetical protein
VATKLDMKSKSLTILIPHQNLLIAILVINKKDIEKSSKNTEMPILKKDEINEVVTTWIIIEDDPEESGFKFFS